MIISRASALVRLHGSAGRNLFQNRVTKSFESVRQSHDEIRWAYRKAPEEFPRMVLIHKIGGGFMWWWITWHIITDYDELLPTSFPDPSKWTDEELGIPPI